MKRFTRTKIKAKETEMLPRSQLKTQDTNKIKDQVIQKREEIFTKKESQQTYSE